MRIGIIGNGFVGSAVNNGFSSHPKFQNSIKIYDKNPSLSKNTLEETVTESDFLFLSLPTPSNRNGSINLDIINSSLSEINRFNNSKNIILVRSTIIPGTTDNLCKKYPKLNLVFNPEFLTEKNAKSDFINQSRIILGGPNKLTEKVYKLYNIRFPNVPIISTNYRTAELIKYMNNCFLATKVSFMNEMKLISDEIDANWDDALEGFKLDERVGHSHNDVPGHDGKLGFGGSCFPKDVSALLYFSKKIGINLNTLSGAWNTNLEVRSEKDWEKLVGRAIVESKD